MPNESCCLWEAEQYDDSLKSMFMAEEAYANGNKAKALAYIKAQVEDRIPLINLRAIHECGRNVDLPKGLAESLSELGKEIEQEKPYEEIHKKVMEIDRKYAVKGYQAFHRCML